MQAIGLGEGEAKAEHRFHEVIRSVLRPLYDGSSVFYRFSAHLNEEPGVRQQVRRTYEVNKQWCVPTSFALCKCLLCSLSSSFREHLSEGQEQNGAVK